MEPDSTASGADLAGTEVGGADEPVDAIRWIGEEATNDNGSGVDEPTLEANGNGTTDVEQLELDGSTITRGNGAHATRGAHLFDDDDDDDDDGHDKEDDDSDVATGAESDDRGAELITISGGASASSAHVGSPGSATVPVHDLEAWDEDDWDEDDDWEDDDWDGVAVATGRSARSINDPEHLTLADVLRVRSARFIAITIVVTFVAVVMATVLLWQRVEDTRAEVNRGKQVTSVPGLAGVHRRLNQLETEVAAILGSPNGDPTGRTDAIQQQLTALNQCVAEFQHTIVSGRRSSVRYC
jgi:hypothetical protein